MAWIGLAVKHGQHYSASSVQVPANGGRYVTFAEHREKSGAFTLHFDAQAASDILLALMLHPAEQDANCFEICIGGRGNTVSSIRFGTSCIPLATAEGNHANGAEFQSYWVSFAHGRLAVGLGSAVDHDNELMMAADMPEIKGAAHHKLHVGFAARDHPVDIVLRTAKHE